MTSLRLKESVMSLSITTNNVNKAVKSYTMSKRYINTMLRATVINILYHRINIEEREFVTKAFNNIPFKTFRSKSRNVHIRDFHSYMTACKDALENNYLKEFYLYFIDTATGNIIENYKFTFKYAEKEDKNHSQTGENLVGSTIDLLKTLQDLETHEKLNSEIEIKVEFTYFDDTPIEYEPPGFRGVEESESLLRKLNKNGNSVVIGTLFTGFHMLKCRGKGDVFNFNSSQITGELDITNAMEEYVEEPVPQKEAENNSHDKKLLTTLNLNSSRAINNIDTILNNTFNAIEAREQSCLKNEAQNNAHAELLTEDLTEVARSDKMNATYLSQCIDLISNDGDELEFSCPCKLSSLELSLDKIECIGCSRKYHAACQGFMDSSFLRQPFRCSNCNDEDDSESIVAAIDSSMSMAVYRVRFILACLYKYGEVPTDLECVFKGTMDNMKALNVFTSHGNNQVTLNYKVLESLFKFDHKFPEKNKLKINLKR